MISVHPSTVIFQMQTFFSGRLSLNSKWWSSFLKREEGVLLQSLSIPAKMCAKTPHPLGWSRHTNWSLRSHSQICRLFLTNGRQEDLIESLNEIFSLQEEEKSGKSWRGRNPNTPFLAKDVMKSWHVISILCKLFILTKRVFRLREENLWEIKGEEDSLHKCSQSTEYQHRRILSSCHDNRVQSPTVVFLQEVSFKWHYMQRSHWVSSLFPDHHHDCLSLCIS